MKKLVTILAGILPFFAFAQSQTQNYVMTTVYQKPFTNAPQFLQTGDADVNITYYDGLGRPIQKKEFQKSASGKDIFTHIEYDGFGRQSVEFLPAVSGAASLDMVANPGQVQSAFYLTGDEIATGDPNFENTPTAFSKKLYEDSPLERVMKQSSPGEDWKLGSGHEVQFQYLTNDQSEVKLFSVQNTFGCSIYDIKILDNGDYQPGELYKNVTKDENGGLGNLGETHEFKDKEGRVVLKRTFNFDEQWQVVVSLDTYYVYDAYGNLTYVLPPMVDLNMGIDQQLDGLCYQYKYDSRNRMAAKKLPGKNWEFMVYDRLDRVIATGPVLNPFGTGTSGAIFTRYDAFGRICYTGWFPYDFSTDPYCNLTQESFVTGATNAVSGTSTIDNVSLAYDDHGTPAGLILLTVNYYDTYAQSNMPALTIPAQVLDDNTISNVQGLQTRTCVRALTDASENFWENSYTFYDSKSRAVLVHTDNHLSGFHEVRTKFDFTGQPIHTQTTQKRTSTSPIRTVQEYFTYTPQGRLLTHTHKINENPLQLLAHNTYDELGKLISKTVGGTDTTTFSGLQKVDYRYNIRGWLTGINDTALLPNSNDPKDLFSFTINYNNPENSSGGLVVPLYNGNISETSWRSESDNIRRKYGYRYDNLNRLKEAIYQMPDVTNAVANSYGESLDYDKNGNITSLMRNGNMDNLVQENLMDDLQYTYDPILKNRLMKVVDNTLDPNGFKDSPFNSAADYAYDDFGNMVRDDNKWISNITYNHLNLPLLITLSTGTIQYIYNAAGEKLQKTVILTGTPAVVTDYLDGYQYKNEVLQFFPTAEGYVNYTPGLEVANNYNYVFNYLDHLGNIRMSYTLDPSDNTVKIMEENHYYPFGLKHQNYNTFQQIYDKENNNVLLKPVPVGSSVGYNYKYNGKEWQEELGLNVYDYGARTYMPDLGRWMQSDPLVNDLDFTFNPTDVDEDDENQLAFSIETTLGNGGGIYNRNNLNPYTYGYNDPVRFDDPDGKCPNCFTAIAGALIGGGIELGGQLLSGKSLGDVDWADVGVETLKGGLIGSGVGAVAAAAIGGGAVVAKASVDYSTNGKGKNVFNGSKSGQEALQDGTLDVVSGAVGGVIGKQAGKMAGKSLGAATKAETRAVKEVSKATNKFNKVTNGGKNMGGSKSMVAKGNLEKAKGGARVARGNTVRSQMVNSATKGVPGAVVNKSAQNASSDKVKQLSN